MKVPAAFEGAQANTDAMIKEADLFALFDGEIDAFKALRERCDTQEELAFAA